ncbi:MAG: hypothetical protein ACYCZF_16740 [Anaerolineae bacterium]
MTTYYINNQPGIGSNANAGISEDAPWRDFGPLHQRPLQPGDKVLLARGCRWNQQLVIKDSGSKKAWCELGAYGAGPRPQIIRNGDAAERGIRMNNLSYWRVRDLEVGNAGIGILVYYNTPGHEGLVFENIFVHDCYGIHVSWFPSQGSTRRQADLDRVGLSSGIFITSEPMELAPDAYVLRDIVLDRIEGTYNADTIAISPNNKRKTNEEGVASYPMRDIVMNHLYFHDDVAPNPGGIPDTLRVINVEHVLVQNSFFDNECGRHTNSGTAIVLMVGVKNLDYVNSSFTRTPDTGSHDQCAIDFESTNRNIRVRNCYFGQNAGPGVEFLDIWGEKCFSLDHEVSGNAFEDNGWATHGGQGGSGGIHHYGGNFASAVIRDNLVYEPGRPLYHGEFINFTLVNNLVASQPLYNAMHGFSAVRGQNGWCYQVKSGSGGWFNLAQFSDELQTWLDAGDPCSTWVSRMEQCTLLPDVSVARTWQAERAGVVAIRGRAMKTYAEGAVAKVRITQNDRVIWRSKRVAAGWEGVETNLDNLVVAQGDLIRFEVSGAADGMMDAVSWAPTIAYIG